MQSSGTQGTRNCVSCGRAFSWDANVCPYCGHDYRVAMMPPPKKESAMPVIGGILIMLPGIGYLIGGAVLAAGSSAFLFGGGVVCGAVLLVLGILAILGGIFAIQKKNFALALIGGIFVVPSILGLIGLILIAVSKDEFTN
jgi:DNA-directed RNA polymerase subunit RPC12/RpoP